MTNETEGKSLATSKTFWAAVLGTAIEVLASPAVTGIIPVEAMPYVLAVNAVIAILLRLFTEKPITSVV